MQLMLALREYLGEPVWDEHADRRAGARGSPARRRCSRAARAPCRSARSRTSRVDGLPARRYTSAEPGEKPTAALPARRRLRGRRPRHPRRAVPHALPPRGRRRAQRRVPQGARAPVPRLRRGRAHGLRWARERYERVAVGGDSAGGNLAATLAIEFDPALALLIYPAVDATQERASRQLFGKGFFLTDELMQWYTGHFLPRGIDPADPLLSPILSPGPEGLRAGADRHRGLRPAARRGRGLRARRCERPACKCSRAASPASSTASSTPSAPALLRATRSSKSQG